MPRKRPKSAFFKAAEKFDSDADLANGLIDGIRPHVGGRVFLMADYDRPRPLVIRGCLVAQVRRRNGYARVYVRGRMVIRKLIGRGCGCCPPYFEGAFFSPNEIRLPESPWSVNAFISTHRKAGTAYHRGWQSR